MPHTVQLSTSTHTDGRNGSQERVQHAVNGTVSAERRGKWTAWEGQRRLVGQAQPRSACNTATAVSQGSERQCCTRLACKDARSVRGEGLTSALWRHVIGPHSCRPSHRACDSARPWTRRTCRRFSGRGQRREVCLLRAGTPHRGQRKQQSRRRSSCSTSQRCRRQQRLKKPLSLPQRSSACPRLFPRCRRRLSQPASSTPASSRLRKRSRRRAGQTRLHKWHKWTSSAQSSGQTGCGVCHDSHCSPLPVLL